MTHARKNYQKYYIRRTKSGTELKIKDSVYYQDKPRSTWKNATVIDKGKDRAYKILTEEGRIIRRNKQLLRLRENEYEMRRAEELDLPIEGMDSIEAEDMNPLENHASSSAHADRPECGSILNVLERPKRKTKLPYRFKDYVM